MWMHMPNTISVSSIDNMRGRSSPREVKGSSQSVILQIPLLIYVLSKSTERTMVATQGLV